MRKYLQWNHENQKPLRETVLLLRAPAEAWFQVPVSNGTSTTQTVVLQISPRIISLIYRLLL